MRSTDRDARLIRWHRSAVTTATGPRETISPGELARKDVVLGLPGGGTATYGAWLAVLQTMDPRFEFTDPAFRNSLPVTLAFAAAPSRPTAVLTCPRHVSYFDLKNLGGGP
jgi:hypothetical protein